MTVSISKIDVTLQGLTTKPIRERDKIHKRWFANQTTITGIKRDFIVFNLVIVRTQSLFPQLTFFKGSCTIPVKQLQGVSKN